MPKPKYSDVKKINAIMDSLMHESREHHNSETCPMCRTRDLLSRSQPIAGIVECTIEDIGAGGHPPMCILNAIVMGYLVGRAMAEAEQLEVLATNDGRVH
jgi:hypothetical protein